MSATTEHRDGSGAVLIEEIRRLDDRVDHFREAYQTLQQRVNVLAEAFANLQPCPEFPPELLSIGTGPARVAIVVQHGHIEHDFVTEINRVCALVEAKGATVESFLPATIGNSYAAFIVYRLPAPETEATQ